MSQGASSDANVQKIFKVRRTYNQWVANQTLEDYALRFTARKSRHMSISMVGRTALGATAFMALEGIAGSLTLTYGFTNTVAAIVVVCLLLFIIGIPITYYAARNGLDIDLLTRGAGFGYLGSTITSLIYASFTFIFFAIEAAILSSALNLLFGIPLPIAYVICAVAVIPIVVKGISAISKFQLRTQSLWLILQIAALAVVLFFEWQHLREWVAFAPADLPEAQRFSWTLFGAAASVLFALVAQIGEQVDYLRFLPEKTKDNSRRWWFWMLFAGPGWVSVGMVKMLLGSFIAYIAFDRGLDALSAGDPTLMYQRAFGYIVHSDRFALILAAVIVIVSQMKINVTNAYAGSIAWSNFFSRLTHSHPGRVVWLIFNVALALLLMELGIYKALESVLGVFAIVAVSWLGCLSADLMINKSFGLSPKNIEFKRGHLFDINPVGVISMVLATSVGLATYLGAFGQTVQTLGHFFSIATCFISVPAVALITRGRYYLARTSSVIASSEASRFEHATCCICENEFETEDLLFCPAYRKTICSLCCSLDGRCLDQCKPKALDRSQVIKFIHRAMPELFVRQMFGRAGKFLIWFSLANIFTAALLALVYRHMVLQSGEDMAVFANGLWTLFFILMIVMGAVTWLFLLSHESRVVAQQESNRQTQKLVDEIDAHKETDIKLQQAKELAERANAAKSRYLSGISHELRTPLQSILGYAQLLGERQDTPSTHQMGLRTIQRSGQYLADLIEGLLDVSKIEAGRLDLHISQFAFTDLIDQLTHMFRMQAENKGITFNLHVHNSLPNWVNADEKRLRQVLINLLNNAIKYTDQGSVDFHVTYRNQVAEFEVVDTGAGIPTSEQERIFMPFERVQDGETPSVPGTGLGLTIVKLLVEIMGGDIQLTSQPGVGSRFKVMLMLPWIAQSSAKVEQRQVLLGYKGMKQTIAIVDDDPVVRGMLAELLAPLGFKLIEANGAEQCLKLMANLKPKLFILDVNMPGESGLELSRRLRDMNITAPIIMLSANAQVPDSSAQQAYGFSDYLVKPVNNKVLLTRIEQLLDIEWLTQENKDQVRVIESKVGYGNKNRSIQIPDDPMVTELLTSIEIGYKRGVIESLAKLKQTGLVNNHDFEYLMNCIERMQFGSILKAVEVI